VVSPMKPDFDFARGRLGPAPVEVRVLDPVPTAGLDERRIGDLMERVRSVMQETLTEMARDRGISA
jgi:hypothetical protein